MNLSHLALILILAVTANYANRVSLSAPLDDSSSTDSQPVFAVGDETTDDSSVDTYDQVSPQLTAIDKVDEDSDQSESSDQEVANNVNALDRSENEMIQKDDIDQQNDDITDQEDTQVGI